MRRRISIALFTALTVPLLAAAEPVRPCPASKPFGIHMEQHERHRGLAMSRSGRLQLWARYPDPVSKTVPESWTVIWRAETEACIDVPGDDQMCGCGSAQRAGVSPISPSAGFFFDPFGPELRVYLPQELETFDLIETVCVGPNGAATGGGPPMLWAEINILPVQQDGAIVVAPTGCKDAQEEWTPECMKHPERFMRIPFRGDEELVSVHPGNLGSAEKRLRVRWEVCCGCGEPPEGAPEGEEDPCGSSAASRGLLEVAINRASALRANLRPRVERYEHNRHQANQYWSDFKLVTNSCAGWDAAMALFQALLGGPTAAGTTDAFTDVFTVISKLLEEDPSAILSGAGGLELGGDAALWDLWVAANDLYSVFLNSQDPNSFASQRRRLQDCSHVPLVSDLVYEGAAKYLEHFEAAIRELPEIERLTTEIQQADTAVLEAWHRYYRDCIKEAECRGTDPAACGPPPP